MKAIYDTKLYVCVKFRRQTVDSDTDAGRILLYGCGLQGLNWATALMRSIPLALTKIKLTVRYLLTSTA